MTEISLPKHWEIKKIGEVGKVISGGTPKTENKDYWNGDISWITPADLSGYTSKFISRGRKSITKLGLENSSARLMPKGTVLFSSRAPIGYVVIVSNDVCTNQGFKSIVPNEKVTSDYLYFFLKSAKQEAEKVASGTTFKEISLKAFSELSIPLPPLSEQVAIVAKIEELLSDLENGKQQLLTAQAQLKVYRQSLLKWAFEGKLTNENVKEGEFPKGWKRVKIGDIGKVQLGRQRSPKHISKDFPTKYIRAANITESGLALNDILEMEFNPKEFEQYKLSYGDLILSEASGSAKQVGKPAMWKNEIEDCCFQNTVIRLRPKEMVSSIFLLWLFKYFYQNGLFAKISGGVGINHLSAGKFSNIEISIPPLEEQQRIVEELESKLTVCDKIEETISQSLLQAETLRQSILKKAFEGKLV